MAGKKPTAQLPYLQPSPRRAGAAAAYVLWWISDSVDFSGDCWTWTGQSTKRGYGAVDLKNYKVPQSIVLVHRLVYSICVGPIPDGLCVLHRCDNPPCCRPDHLFLGTDIDNILDKVSKGRQANGQAVRTNHDHLKGEVIVTSILTDEKVMEIRHRDARGESGASLALEFGISVSQISSIVKGKSWAHLPVLDSGSRSFRPCPKCGLKFSTRGGLHRRHVESCQSDLLLGKS